MKKRGIIALATSLLITAIPLPLSTVLADPMAGMGIFILYFFIIMPLFLLFLGCYLGKHWRKLWWIPLAATGLFGLLGFFFFDTWQFFLYVPGYLILCYGAMMISNWISKGKETKSEQTKMDLQDL